jgi:hypothetical protein
MKRFWIPLTLVLIHAGLAAFLGLTIALGSDGEAKMGWAAFFLIDFPVSLCLLAPPPAEDPTLPIFILGTIQWGIIGFVFPRWFRRKDKGAEHGNQ